MHLTFWIWSPLLTASVGVPPPTHTWAWNKSLSLPAVEELKQKWKTARNKPKLWLKCVFGSSGSLKYRRLLFNLWITNHSWMNLSTLTPFWWSTGKCLCVSLLSKLPLTPSQTTPDFVWIYSSKLSFKIRILSNKPVWTWGHLRQIHLCLETAVISQTSINANSGWNPYLPSGAQTKRLVVCNSKPPSVPLHHIIT